MSTRIPAIRTEEITKRYRLGQLRRGRAMHEALENMIRRPFKRLPIPGNTATPSEAEMAADRDHIWALKGINLDIAHGEVVGLIGHNGAGKSALLKILSRVTKPTGGKAEIWGRVGSMLEVGTGFHPELTGRENIFLNGAILGMKKVEIADKFDSIVEFSEVAKFLDTPVKRFSSGMSVRLAFAVAAHLEPEILLIDEVLAVGDAAFQNKSLQKIKEVASHGRTIIFVSHNLNAVRSICRRAVLLKDGRIAADGPTDEVIAVYERQNRLQPVPGP